jgi:class 3 adenylate cyclase
MNDEPLSLQQLNRTFIGSVLFIDIVDYSRGTVPEQIAMKEMFIRLLTDAVQNVAPGDRIMVDTGDGAGVAFLGDPEDALFAALSLRDAIDAGKAASMGQPGFVRMGINLGPLKMVRDINGHTNMIGDAVNDAQRVMSFAAAGQVMVSHSYYDIISRFSVDYAKLFSYEGARRDKHVREHQVYSFGHSADTEILQEKLRDRSRARNPNSIMPNHFDEADSLHTAPTSPPSVKAAPPAAAKLSPGTAPANKGRSIRLGLVAAVVLCVVGVSSVTAVLYLYGIAPVIAVRNATPATPATPAAPATSVMPVERKTVEASPDASLKVSNSVEATPAATVNATTNPVSNSTFNAAPSPVVAEAAKSASEPAAVASVDSASATQPSAPAARPGTVILSIEPWGEIFVDGVNSGISPPLKSLKLAPGKHKIEIRNGDFAPYRKTIQVKSDTGVAVHYVF